MWGKGIEVLIAQFEGRYPKDKPPARSILVMCEHEFGFRNSGCFRPSDFGLRIFICPCVATHLAVKRKS